MKKRTGGRRAGNTWDRILDSAESLFARQGYNGTTTRQIAAKAGISIQTLHYHCGGKKNLYSAVLERSIVPVTALVNRYVEKMLDQDLTDPKVLEASVSRIIDELFDVLHTHPNYALLFYRQWIVQDPELRAVEWEKLTPVLRRWSRRVQQSLDKEKLGGLNLFLLFFSLSWMYWGLFVQPSFIAGHLGLRTDSPRLLRILKNHAWEMTLRMMERRQSASFPPFGKARMKDRARSGAGYRGKNGLGRTER